jgi:dTDP-4-dehydrorhamnose 3,5-epimerase
VRFAAAGLAGVYIVELDRLEDERGFFARTFCRDEFAAHGLQSNFVQCNLSFNARKGTLRGLHYQAKPHEEAKLVRCTRGALFDVVVDIRTGSPTYRKWISAELTADNGRMLYVPEGYAHGFQTIADDTEIFYQMGEAHHSASSRGMRWNDSALAIRWPLANPIVSARDAGYPDLDP